MKHDDGAALSYFVGAGTDVLPVVVPGNRPYGQLAAVGVEQMMWGVKRHRPGSGKYKAKYTLSDVAVICSKYSKFEM